MQYKSNWAEAKANFTAWWAHRSGGRPLLSVWAVRDEPAAPVAEVRPFEDESQYYLDVDGLVRMQLNDFALLEPMADAMPTVSLNLGAGSMALYLGSEPVFRRESVWFEPSIEDYGPDGTVSFDPSNRWYARHIEMYRRAAELIGGTDALLDIPDIVENIDVLSAMRGPQRLCYDLYDHPDEVKAAVWKINGIYRACYDGFHGICAGEDGGSSFTAFAIWGPGRTAKVQCDHCAMISPGQFREFVQEPLREQCRWLDNSLYHLDGPDCLCHVPALMEIGELNALQWTPGDGNPLAGEPCWDGLWRQVKDAGKGAWVSLYGYAPDVAAEKARRLVRAFGGGDFYFLFPRMGRREAEALLLLADRSWK